METPQADEGDTTEHEEMWQEKWVGVGNPGVSVIYPSAYLWLA